MEHFDEKRFENEIIDEDLSEELFDEELFDEDLFENKSDTDGSYKPSSTSRGKLRVKVVTFFYYSLFQNLLSHHRHQTFHPGFHQHDQIQVQFQRSLEKRKMAMEVTKI